MITNVTTIGGGLGRMFPSVELAWGLGCPFEVVIPVPVPVRRGRVRPWEAPVELYLATQKEMSLTTVHGEPTPARGRGLRARHPEAITGVHGGRLTRRHGGPITEEHDKPLN